MLSPTSLSKSLNDLQLRAFYGDAHGCNEELRLLHALVESKYPGIEHWHAGDLVDRGPDSGDCVRFAKKYFTGGIMGNHERSIVKLWLRWKKHGLMPRNPDKANTIRQLTEDDVSYLQSLPYIHVFDDVKCVLCHGGLFPRLPFHYQSDMVGVTNNQMIRANGVISRDMKGKIHYTPEDRRWFGGEAHMQPKVNKTEAESREEGFVRWYELYDHEYDCIYGHSVLDVHPFIFQKEGHGRTIGIDTGSCFGGYLTALIYPTMEYIRVECGEYAEGRNVKRFRNKGV